ncbi:hypothetical protein B4U79_04340 [Dinothrombium tinctorium]|nr:hypothetical protein B4U79_04340 [Dinothrombium tinctorium]
MEEHSDVDSDGSDNDGAHSESEGDELVEKEIADLKDKLCQNPYDYDSHVKLIAAFRSTGDLLSIREAREKMAKNFPLTPELWLEWIKDESGIAANDEDKAYIFELFERAVNDYVSIDVWIEYVQFSIGLLNSENGLQKVRDVFEKAVSTVGLHVPKGSLIWEAYREFENSIIDLIPEHELLEHHQRILNLFKRQLRIPLLNMENTYEEFKQWFDEVNGNEKGWNIEDVDFGYNKALIELQKLKPYEDSLIYSNNSYEDFLKYIEYEEANGTPPRVQIIYERAILHHCLTPDVWLKYTKYVDFKMKIQSLSEKVYERAVRNCPWVVSLWDNYIKCLERFEDTKTKIQLVFERALESGFQTGDEYRQIWLTYLDYTRRKTDFQDEKEIEKLRKCFEAAKNHLNNFENGDLNGVLLQYLAKIEAKFCKNIENARKIWNESLLNRRFISSQAQMWIEFANLERLFGEEEQFRKILMKGLQSAKDYPESIGETLVKYEREEGTSIDSLDEVMNKYEKVMTKINAKRQVIAEKEKSQLGEKAKEKIKQTQKQELKGKRKIDVANAADTSLFKKPLPPNEATPSKKSKVEIEVDNKSEESSEISSSKPNFLKPSSADSELKKLQTVFVSNLDFNTSEDTLRKVFSEFGEISELRLVRNYKGLSKGLCYIEYSSIEATKTALKHDRMPIDGRPVFINEVGKKHQFQYQKGLEKNKLFVKNLDRSLTQEEIREVFEKYGKVKDVRLVTFRNGYSKGLAYIEFEDELGAQNGLKADGMLLKDRIITVALSNPSEKKKKAETNETMLLGSASLSHHSSSNAKPKINIPMIPAALRKKIKPADSNGLESNSNANDQHTSLKNSDFRDFFKK